MKKPFLSFKVQPCPKSGGGGGWAVAGRIQELKGGGAEVKYVRTKISCPLWCIKGYAKLGGGKLGEASRSRLHTRGLGKGCVSFARSA